MFWEQKQHGLVSEINLLRTEELAKPMFRKHFDELLSDYNKVLLINLVRKSRPEEHLLTTSLVKMFKLIKNSKLPEDMNIRSKVKFVMFDFHAETKGDDFSKLNRFTEELSQVQQQFGFFTGLRN